MAYCERRIEIEPAIYNVEGSTALRVSNLLNNAAKSWLRAASGNGFAWQIAVQTLTQMTPFLYLINLVFKVSIILVIDHLGKPNLLSSGLQHKNMNESTCLYIRTVDMGTIALSSHMGQQSSTTKRKKRLSFLHIKSY